MTAPATLTECLGPSEFTSVLPSTSSWSAFVQGPNQTYRAHMDGVCCARICAEELLSGLPQRWAHVQAVASLAKQLADAFNPQDGETLLSAAYLHDIGYAPSVQASGFHALDGARYVRIQGFDPRVASLVAHHTCAAVEAELRGLLEELTAEFPEEHSPVSDALCYCDMTIGPHGELMSPEQRIREIRARYGAGHLVSRSIVSASGDLLASVRRTEQRLATLAAVV